MLRLILLYSLFQVGDLSRVQPEQLPHAAIKWARTGLTSPVTVALAFEGTFK